MLRSSLPRLQETGGASRNRSLAGPRIRSGAFSVEDSHPHSHRMRNGFRTLTRPGKDSGPSVGDSRPRGRCTHLRPARRLPQLANLPAHRVAVESPLALRIEIAASRPGLVADQLDEAAAPQAFTDRLAVFPGDAFEVLQILIADRDHEDSAGGMLLHQGAWAFTIWTGTKPAADAMRKALEKAVYGEETRRD